MTQWTLLFQWPVSSFLSNEPLWAIVGIYALGHASSPDLIHWKDHPIALTPEEGAGDDLGCFSGCIVDDDGIPTAIYTGFVNFVDTPVLLARAKDEALDVWKRVLKSHYCREPIGVNSTDFRDPYVWRQDDRWQMVVGAGMEMGTAAFYYMNRKTFSPGVTWGRLFRLKSSILSRCGNAPIFSRWMINMYCLFLVSQYSGRILLCRKL